MVFVKRRSVVLTMVLVLALAALVSSQITFSRDWTGGKRSAPLALDCSQFARLCKHFLHEVKTAMEAIPDGSTKHRRSGEDPPLSYEDE